MLFLLDACYDRFLMQVVPLYTKAERRITLPSMSTFSSGKHSISLFPCLEISDLCNLGSFAVVDSAFLDASPSLLGTAIITASRVRPHLPRMLASRT